MRHEDWDDIEDSDLYGEDHEFDDDDSTQEPYIYTPRGACRDLFVCRDLEVLLEGPAGTGKTRAGLEKAHLYCSTFERARILLLRKFRSSMNESILVTFEQNVLPPGHYLNDGHKRIYRQSYDYANGSSLVIGGLDNADKIMSTEYDMIFVFEATEVEEEEWEMCLTRLRNNKLPYHQAVADCNPGPTRHWLNIRGEKMTRLRSRHTDNPTLYTDDHVLTPAGESYLGVLNRLTGSIGKRLRDGVWAQTTGLVYDSFTEKSIIDFEGQFSDYFIGIDYGTSNPAVFLAVGLDISGALVVVDEYRWDPSQHNGIQRTDYEHAQAFLTWSQPYRSKLRWTFIDPSASSFILELRRLPGRFHLKLANNTLLEGIRKVSTMFAAENLYVHERCVGLCEELNNYTWDTKASERGEDRPVKFYDHGPDALRYVINSLPHIYNQLMRKTNEASRLQF